ncbi:Myosin-10 [Cichlidogyrus casuarinus]|uniref:Myosin-10 n=1 Tax=Cichlidogyrus casuarinus TaxID=1844966 RepID=A0ABD2Q6P7_9PLAT
MRATLGVDQDKINFSEFRNCIQEYYSLKNSTGLMSPIPTQLSIEHLGSIDEQESFNFLEEQYVCEGELRTNPYKPCMNQNTFDEIDESTSTSGVGGSLIGMATVNPVTMHELDVMYQEHERLKNDIIELQSQVLKTNEGREQAIDECRQLQNKLSFMEVHFREIEQNWKDKFDAQLDEMQSKISLEHRTPKENEELARLLKDREELKQQKVLVEKQLHKTESSYSDLKMSFEDYKHRTGKQMVDNLREKERAMGLMEQIHLELEVTRGKLNLAMGQPVDLEQYSENSKRLYEMIHKSTASESRLRSPSLGCWIETDKALKCKLLIDLFSQAFRLTHKCTCRMQR